MPQYKFITLDFPFTDDTRAYGLNNAGQVVGSYGVLDPQGFLFSNNTFSTLNDPNLTFGPGNHATTATGINDQNEIVGFTGAGHAFYDIAGTFTDFTWPGATSTWAEGVNASGQIVGYARNISIGMAGGNIVGYLYDQGNFTTISDPLASTAQGLGTFAQDINDSGQIVGYFDAASGVGTRGFLYSNGTYTTLDAFGATNGTFATGINNVGQIVGYYRQVGSGQPHSFLYSGGVFTSLDDPHGVNGTFATDINDSGEITGYYLDSHSIAHSFVTQALGAFDDPAWGVFGIADFNGDHKADLGFLRLSDNLPEIQFQDGAFAAGGGAIANNPFDSSFRAVTAADFNHDGDADLLYQRVSDGLTEIQFLNGLTPVGGGVILNNPFDSQWRIATTGDFNGDGNADIAWQRKSDGLLEIQLLNGLTPAGGGVVSNNPFDSSWHIFGNGDFNGDGKTDLIWLRNSDGLLEIQFLNGNNSIGGGTIANSPFDSSWALAGIGDFNGDGKSDLVLRRNSDGLTEIEFLKGNTSAGGGAIVNNPFDLSWSLASVGDFNGDGKSDLVWRRNSDGLTEIQLLNGFTPIGGGLATTPMGNRPFFQTSPSDGAAGVAAGQMASAPSASDGSPDSSQIAQAIAAFPGADAIPNAGSLDRGPNDPTATPALLSGSQGPAHVG